MTNHFDRLTDMLRDAVAAGRRPVGWKLQHGLFVYLLAREERFYHAVQLKDRRPATLLGLPYEINDFSIAEDCQLVFAEQTPRDVAEEPSATRIS